MKDIIVCDLDGTLCNIDHRLHFVQVAEGAPRVANSGDIIYPRKDWNSFFAGVPNDTVNKPVLEVLERFQFEGFKIIFSSGRPERCRADTVQWFYKHTDLFEDTKAGETISAELRHKDRVLFVLDDRDQVVDMWRRNGLTCFQVAEGDF